MTNRIYSFIGLAAKARALVSGDDTCEMTIKKGKAKLVIIAGDASPNTKKKFEEMCEYRHIDKRIYGEKEFIGKYIGKDVRSVIAVTERNFAGRLKELIDENNIEFGGEQIGKI
jgi:ribosomal protein L7Ae-like RNA K-turn-binding protein